MLDKKCSRHKPVATIHCIDSVNKSIIAINTRPMAHKQLVRHFFYSE